ncbi:MAG: SusC/RagA family TonB-linked outer membrane protein [Bacteroidales bacterium]|nr:SusC/RagA family TonB-linked outer membrane protein [Bacteroidales bacterium]MDT8432797.1 SusC/RagA family TonB-linked outer membrane protein [Bacteroidales bacterium]
MKRILMSIAFFGISLGLFAQARSITGNVTLAEDGSPLPGVSVVAAGTTVGAITDFDGNYAIDVPATATVLRFTFVGLQTEEVEIGNQTVINVAMVPSTEHIEEVLVVAYGTSTKESFTGSAVVVDADEIGRRQVSDISNALAGAVSGVQTLNSNGQPGTSSTIRIRGVGSINAGTSPLIVLDGVPFDGDLSSINPADIKSTTILKDAASTALYGARGANGIIMITTKSGVPGKSKISLDYKRGVNSRAVKNYEVLTSPQNYTETAYQAIYNAGIYNLDYTPAEAHAYANNNIMTESAGGYGYQIYTIPEGEYLVGSNGKLNPSATLGYSDGEYYYTPDNWADETFMNNQREEVNLAVSGGNETSTYRISLGNLRDEGIVPSSAFSRTSVQFKGDHQVKKWLKVGANVNYNNIVSDYPGEQTRTTSSGNAFFVANFIAPVYPLYVREAETQDILLNNGRKVYDYGDGVSTNFDRTFMSIANPSGDLLYNKTDYLMGIVNSNAYAELTPLRGLTITARYGLNVDNTRYNDMGNAYMGQSAAYGGTAYQSQTEVKGFNQQYVANYVAELDGGHGLDLTAGYDGYSYNFTRIAGSGQNLYNPESYFLSNVIDAKDHSGYKNEYVTKGYFARANYSFMSKYYASLTYRRDASSRFHPDNRWGDFWSLSGAWNLSSESFMSASWINLLKLKASYGEQGNDNLGGGAAYYAYQDQWNVTGADGVFSDGSLAYKGNPDLTWETSTSYNIGADFTFFNYALSGTIEYFGRTAKDMLYYKPVQGSVGYPELPMNVGSMTNSGLEISVQANLIRTENITWEINANTSLIKNTINELHPDLEGELIDGSYIYSEGESRYRMYLVDYAGVDAATGEALYWAQDSTGAAITTTDYRTAEDYKIASEDLLPKAYGGFGTTITAFGFDASIQCSYQVGGLIYDSGYRRLMHGGTTSFAGNNWHKDIYDAWTEENTTSDIPRLNSNDRFANSSSTRWLTSSNYLSLNNITVGYSLPATMLSRVQITQLRVYAAADNVALLSARKGLDPRQSYTTATTARYTPIRTISAGIQLTF